MPQAPVEETSVERLIKLHIEKLPEGVYLATSDDVQGLVVQANTVSEAVDIARDVARQLMEAQAEREGRPDCKPIGDSIDITLVVGI